MKNILFFVLFLFSSACAQPYEILGQPYLVDPDGERSFCACLQAEDEISEADLSLEYFKAMKMVHVKGDSLFNGAYVEKSLQIAKSAGAKVSLDLTHVDLAEQFRERILSLLETYTDLLFTNEAEAYALTQLPPERAAQFLINFCPLVVIKSENQGCWVCSKEGLFHSPAIATHPQDSTERGDLFTSAFLYGYLNGYAIQECARIGNMVKSKGTSEIKKEIY